MSLRLYYNTASPFARKVLLFVHETGLAGKVELIWARGTPLDSTTMPLAQNPLGKLPVLERDDGGAVHDSRVICRYLSHVAGAHLYPSPPALWETLTLEALGDGMMEAAMTMVYERRLRGEEAVNTSLIEGYWGKYSRAVAAIEDRWMGHLTSRLDAGQLAIAAALGYADFRHGDRDWRGDAPQLATWFGQFGQRESMQATQHKDAYAQ